MLRLQTLLVMLCALLASINSRSYKIESVSSKAIVTPDSCSVSMSDAIVVTYDGTYSRLSRAIVTNTATKVSLISITSPDVTITRSSVTHDAYAKYLLAEFSPVSNRTVTLNFQYELLDGVNTISSTQNQLYLQLSYTSQILKTRLDVDLSAYNLQGSEDITVKNFNFQPTTNITASSVTCRLSETIPGLQYWAVNIQFPKGLVKCSRPKKKKARVILIVCLAAIIPVAVFFLLMLVLGFLCGGGLGGSIGGGRGGSSDDDFGGGGGGGGSGFSD